ncbi:MAG: phosphodiesterase [Candidatus Methylomirabilia bacterium]
MLIAQITDLHVVAENTLCYDRVETNTQLKEAVAHLNGLEPSPDVVIASGDLTDHGALEEYTALRRIVSELIPPLYLIPGNHDHRDVFLEAFSDQDYLPRPGAPFAHYAIDDHDMRLVGLDTTVPGRHTGMLCEARLAWLDETLGAESQRPTLIFMHHPPFRTGIRWMDAVGLRGGRRMEEIVSRHRQVERVACGHLHRPIQVAWGGTVACIAPSTCHQIALNLTDAGGFDFVMEPRAVQLHVMDPGYGLVSHTSYVSDHLEVFQPLSELRARTLEEIYAGVKRGYERLSREEFDVRTYARRAPDSGSGGG